MNISIEKGKMLIIRLMAIGAVVEGKDTRDVWFEVNGEVRAVPVQDRSAAVETVSREKATSDPGSVGAPMSGVVVEVRVKEGQEVKKGDILCVQSAMKVRLQTPSVCVTPDASTCRWRVQCQPLFRATSSG